ncbi:MAG: DUF3798 domain-containing protein [Christensenellales bacterium]
MQNKKNSVVVLALVAVVAIVVAVFGFVQKADVQKKADELTKQVETLTAEIEQLKADAETARLEAETAKLEAERLEAEKLEAEKAAAAKYKIAILTGTVSQGEEEYRAAEMLKAKYPDIVVTDTYPDRFAAEVETTIGKILAFAADPEVKAIIMCQAVQGTAAAYTQIRNDLGRDDILLIAGVPAEDPQTITAAADFVMGVDEINGGIQIAQTAKDWGADVLIHYSFARHMGYETIVARHNILKEETTRLGIELVDRDAPDPTGDAGMSGAQNFILEDVPKVMKEFEGKKVAFFCTNCGMQEALQAAVLKEPNAFYPLPCCPSPFHGFPASLGVAVEEAHWGDINAYIKKAAAILKEHDALERFSTWPAPVNYSIITGAFEYATNWINGKYAEKAVFEDVKASMDNATGYDVQISNYEDGDGKSYPTYFMLYFDRVNFAEFAE